MSSDTILCLKHKRIVVAWHMCPGALHASVYVLSLFEAKRSVRLGGRSSLYEWRVSMKKLISFHQYPITHILWPNRNVDENTELLKAPEYCNEWDVKVPGEYLRTDIGIGLFSVNSKKLLKVRINHFSVCKARHL